MRLFRKRILRLLGRSGWESHAGGDLEQKEVPGRHRLLTGSNHSPKVDAFQFYLPFPTDHLQYFDGIWGELKMQEQEEEALKRFLEKLKMPKRDKSKPSHQQSASSQYRARRIILDVLNERGRQRQEKQKAEEDAKNQGVS